jgi:glycosyltransferase involved in cell wall biosynthesis
MRTIAVMHIPQAGGPAQHLKPWLAALRARGPVEVVVPGAGTAASLYEDFDRVDILDYAPLTAGTSALERVAQLPRSLRYVALFRQHFRTRRPDLVVVVTTVVPAALIAAALADVPRIVYAAEIFDKRYLRSPLRSLGARSLARLVEKLSSAVVCCSGTVATQFRNGTRVETIYPGLDDSFTGGDGDSFRRRHGLIDATPLLAVIGNISPGRGQDLAVRAMKEIGERLPKARCVVVGEPHPRPLDLCYRDEVVGLGRELRLDEAVLFTGFTERIADVYAAADIVINPARFNEPFGRVAIEAISAGRPVVSTRVGAVPEVLRDRQDALLVPPDDALALADAVIELWEDADLRSRIVAQGRLAVERRFRLDDSVAQFLRLVSEALDEP